MTSCHIVLLATVLGLAAGGVACYLLGEHAAECTAKTYIEVLAPAVEDPLTAQSLQTQKDIEYAHRLTMAHTIRSSQTFKELVGREAIRRTKWFRSFGEAADKAVNGAIEDLKRHLLASARRDSGLVEIRMTCRDPKEAGLIVNEVVDLMFDREDEESGDITSQRNVLEGQRQRVQAQLSAIDNDNRDLLPAQAEQRERVRKERIGMIDAIDRQVEKIQLMRDRSRIELKRATSSPAPAQVRYPAWLFSCVPGGGILGFVFGLMFVFLSDKARCNRDQSDYTG
jgi:hypothetical protein